MGASPGFSYNKNYLASDKLMNEKSGVKEQLLISLICAEKIFKQWKTAEINWLKIWL